MAYLSHSNVLIVSILPQIVKIYILEILMAKEMVIGVPIAIDILFCQSHPLCRILLQ